ncbi:MAG: ATP-binding protein, partial [bacterium]
WWAYALYVLFIATLLFGIIRFQISRERWKQELALEHLHAEKLAEIDQMKSRFFANISHEFRTPLTLILGPLEMLLSNDFIEPVKKQFKVMHRNGKRLLRLINQLLDLSKLEAGNMSLQARPENIIKLLKGVVLAFSSLAERKKIDLRFQPPEGSKPSGGLLHVYLDRDKFEKIISNLLSNAFKFTPAGGEISVKVSVTNDTPLEGDTRRAGGVVGYAEITISDSGVGIPADRIDKIFDRFYQADSSQTREQEGTGIGLALTKELVELHYGEIQVKSELGKGATFIVRLPLGKDHLKKSELVDTLFEEETPVLLEPEEILDDLASQPSEGFIPTQGSGELPMILIVEDNADVRVYIRDYLDESYRVLEAEDGEQGFEKATEWIPDLIISDVMMPKMDGYALCQKLKTDEKTSHIPVILLTARASGESKVEGLETGADDYIIKPFDAKELQVRVKNLIQQRQKLRQRWSREITLQPKDVAITSTDEQFLLRATEVVDKYMSDPDFSTETFAHEIFMSRMQLNRKLQALTDQATGKFVRTMRLKRAAKLLEQKGSATIVEIAYEVGFSSPAYFAKCFKELFGQLPSDYARHKKTKS